MDTYDVTSDQVIDWAQHYASFDELELTVKALYALYVQERKRNYPEKQKANKHYYRLRKRGGS